MLLWARMTDRKAGRVVFFPIQYADDFVVLVAATREQAEQEKAALAEYLRDTMRLELSIEKTKVVDLTEGFQFLGLRVRYKWHPSSDICRGSKSQTASGWTFGTR